MNDGGIKFCPSDDDGDAEELTLIVTVSIEDKWEEEEEGNCKITSFTYKTERGGSHGEGE